MRTAVNLKRRPACISEAVGWQADCFKCNIFYQHADLIFAAKRLDFFHERRRQSRVWTYLQNKAVQLQMQVHAAGNIETGRAECAETVV